MFKRQKNKAVKVNNIEKNCNKCGTECEIEILNTSNRIAKQSLCLECFKSKTETSVLVCYCACLILITIIV